MWRTMKIQITWIFWESESPQRTPERWDGATRNKTTTIHETQGCCETEMRYENKNVEEKQTDQTTTNGTQFLKVIIGKVAEMINVDVVDEEATMMVKRIIVLRLSTKHINMWIRQLEMKRREIGELARLMGFY